MPAAGRDPECGVGMGVDMNMTVLGPVAAASSGNDDEVFGPKSESIWCIYRS